MSHRLRRLWPFSLAAVLTAGLISSARAGDDLDAEALPLRKITLYRSGVAYFERAATIRGDQVIRLEFDTDQVNDILKSMTILDLGGGTVGPVSYGSREPLDRRLASFGVDISNSPSIATLFQQLRGAALTVETIDGPVEGTILGVEDRSMVAPAGSSATIVQRAHVSLVTAKGIRSISIASIASFELSDPKLATELQLALAALAEQRAERVKAVEVSFLGPEGEDRTVVVSYIHEMPVWKTSYRLVLDPTTDQPTLQGWAIVENTTDEEWRGVELSLASGRPSSFTMDLYDPIFVQRPEVAVPTETGLVARNYEADRHLELAPPTDSATPTKQRKYAGRPQANRGEGERAASVTYFDAGGDGWGRDQMAGAQASGFDSGGQFLYTLDAPVHLARQRSAMLPIILADVTGRKVSIFNPADDAKHPLFGIELTNDTQLHLMPGPISVYVAGNYAGDSQIPHTARNQKRLLSYAMDLDVGAQIEEDGTDELVRIRIVGGRIEQESKYRRSVAYHFTNFDDEERTLLVEHHRNAGWTLLPPAAPIETTENLARFELALGASSEVDLTVEEEYVQSSYQVVTSLPLETALEYRRNGKASDAVVQALTEAAGLQARVGELERASQGLEQERQLIATEQKRIRENLARLEATSDLTRRYVQKLGEQEDRLDEMEERRITLLDALQTARTDFDDFVRDLEID